MQTATLYQQHIVSLTHTFYVTHGLIKRTRIVLTFLLSNLSRKQIIETLPRSIISIKKKYRIFYAMAAQFFHYTCIANSTVHACVKYAGQEWFGSVIKSLCTCITHKATLSVRLKSALTIIYKHVTVY